MSDSPNIQLDGCVPRIGYMLRMYPRFSQTFVANEMAELERQGADLRILSLRKPTDGYFHEAICRIQAKAEYLPESVHGHRREVSRTHWKWVRRNPGAYFDARRVLRTDVSAEPYDLYRAMALLRWVKRNRIDHVHVHFGTSEATVALLANILGGLSYSLTLHAFDIFRQNVNLALLARKINHSRFTITVSEFNRKYLVGELPGVDPERIRLNYNGVDLDRFCVIRKPANPPLIFGLGRLIEKKGFIHLIRAIGKLRRRGIAVRCCIGGSGPARDALDKAIQEERLDGTVTLDGSLCEREVRERMAEATCMVLPCVRAADGNMDALPTVLLEAQAAGCPVITTRLSGNPEIVTDGESGLLVEPEDEDALANAIERVIADLQLAGSLSAGGRRRAEVRFDARRNVARMLEWFGETRRKAATRNSKPRPKNPGISDTVTGAA